MRNAIGNYVTCPHCLGTGEMNGVVHACQRCSGRGSIAAPTNKKSLTVAAPERGEVSASEQGALDTELAQYEAWTIDELRRRDTGVHAVVGDLHAWIIVQHIDTLATQLAEARQKVTRQAGHITKLLDHNVKRKEFLRQSHRARFDLLIAQRELQARAESAERVVASVGETFVAIHGVDIAPSGFAEQVNHMDNRLHAAERALARVRGLQRYSLMQSGGLCFDNDGPIVKSHELRAAMDGGE